MNVFSRRIIKYRYYLTFNIVATFHINLLVFYIVTHSHCKSKALWFHSRRSFSALSLDNLKIDDVESYKKFEPKLDTSLTKLMNGLAGCNVSKLSPDVDLITFSEGSLRSASLKSASHFIYTRSFYPELLKMIRKYKRVVLLSNPGTGKSMFQFYYLTRLLNPKAFSDPLPPDSSESSEIPEVVIRQVGERYMEVYFVQAKVAHLVPVVSQSLLRCFDPKTTLYFFEPVDSRIEPMSAGMTMPIFSCCSPDEVRYKEFCKNGGITFYMPLFTFSELQTIGKHMREQPNFPSDLKSLYSDEGILKSYNEYGGIIRHVLPTSLKYVKRIEDMKKQAIAVADWHQYLRNANIERSDISHFVVKYVVCRSTFDILSYELINTELETKVKEYLKNMTLNQIIALLMSATQSIREPTKRLIYEELFAMVVVDGFEWLKRPNDESDQRLTINQKEKLNYSVFSLKLENRVDEEVKFNDMEMDVLYKPPDMQFPFCDSYYKIKLNNDAPGDPANVKFVAVSLCFGVSNSSKYRQFTSFPKFNERVKMPENIPMEFLHIPHPSIADTVKITINIKRKINVDIIKVPMNFKSSLKTTKRKN